jgi:formylglycine-generating enzyme required for sulfatase activity
MLLRATPEPTLRSYLIERLSACGAPRPLVVRLSAGKDQNASVTSAVILALGEFGPERFSAEQLQQLVRQLLSIYGDDADSGIHAAAGWLLQTLGQTSELRAIDERLATGSIDGPRRWYVTRELQTMVLLMPPGAASTGGVDGPRTPRVNRTFAISSREITVREFQRFRKEHVADKQSAQTEECPINEVTWFDAAAYCNWLSEREGVDPSQWCYAPNDRGEYAAGMKVKADSLQLIGYRLPTVDEWEFACRAGSATRWSMGDAAELLDRYAWYAANSGMRTRPVGTARPNDFGLFDMNGNVWEWCHDRFKNRDDQPDAESGESAVVDEGVVLALRGGTYLNDLTSVGSTAEIRNPPYSHTGADGFRVARTMP